MTCLWTLTGHISNNAIHIRTPQLSYLKSIQTHATTLMDCTHHSATPSLLTCHGTIKIWHVWLWWRPSTDALALPDALAVLLVEVSVEDTVGIEPDLLVVGVVLLLLRWQPDHGMDCPILLSGQGARAPPPPFLHNAGVDGFLLCDRPRHFISRLRCRHFRRDTGLGGPYPLLPMTAACSRWHSIVCPTGDGEGEIFRRLGPR